MVMTILQRQPLNTILVIFGYCYENLRKTKYYEGCGLRLLVSKKSDIFLWIYSIIYCETSIRNIQLQFYAISTDNTYCRDYMYTTVLEKQNKIL